MFDARVANVPIHRVTATEVHPEEDWVAAEEPLEIRLDYESEDKRLRKSISVTMRTPGNDAELAIGFLFTEGIIQTYDQIVGTRQDDDTPRSKANVLTIVLKPEVHFDAQRLERHFYTTSSCGVCGKASLDALRMAGCPELPKEGPLLNTDFFHGLPELLREAQAVFAQTGGLHAAALFDTAQKLLALREDVGRHNAADKLIGASLYANRIPLHDRIMVMSGRLSFELVQKALMAGTPVLAAVGAPSSLAIKLARAFGMTLLGFVRGGRFNVYSGAWRLREIAHAETIPTV